MAASETVSSIWFDHIEPPRFRPLAHTLDVDICIIGGGITGISAAYYLAKAGRPAVLIEAHRIGRGATGRSSGILSTVPEANIVSGPSVRLVRRALALTREGVRAIEEVSRKEHISCGFTPTTEWGVALEPSKVNEAREIYQVRKLLGLSTRFLTRREAARHFSFPVFAALEDPSVTIDPVRFLMGLAEVAVLGGARIYEETRVGTIEEDRGSLRLITDQGTIRAKWVFLATEAYTPAIPDAPAVLGSLSKRLIPATVFSLATAPLPWSLLKALSWEDRKVIWTEYGIYNDLRVTPDNRIIIGGEEIAFRGSAERSDPHERHYEHLERTLRNLFPQLEGIPVTHRWQGTLAFSVDEFPFLGPVGKHLFVSSGYGGHGLAFGHLGGRLFAEYVLRKRVPKASRFFAPERKLYEPILGLSRSLLQVFLRLPGPLRFFVLRLAMWWLHLLDRIDRLVWR